MTKPLFPLREISGELSFSSPWPPVALRGEIFFSSRLRVFVAHLFLLVCVSTATAQDRVTVTRDEKTITLSNGLVEVVTDRLSDSCVCWIDNTGKKTKVAELRPSMRGPATVAAAQPPQVIAKQMVVEHGDGSATVVMVASSDSHEHVTAYLRIQPGVTVVTCVTRVENLSAKHEIASLGWRFSESLKRRTQITGLPMSESWYRKDLDVNVLVLCDSAVNCGIYIDKINDRSEWRFGREQSRLPAYSAFTSQITIGVASGIGPVSAASDAAAINAAKDASGKWMIAVVPFGRLINAEITVTAGLKTYRQTVNAGPREPFVVDTPLTDEKITVELKAANGQILLRSPPPPPPEVVKDEAAKVDMEQISKQRVERMNAVLKAMEDKNYDAALMLARQMSGPIDGGLSGDTLWMKLIGALAEQQAGHKEEAEKMLRRIVADDPSAAEAWWLLGDEEKAGALGDVKVIRMTMDALRAGRLPGAE